MLWARLGEASNLFTEYGVLTDWKCLANSSEVTKCLELERGCGAQLVERDHSEGRQLPWSSQDTAHCIFLISRLSLLGEYLGHWSGGGRLCLITSTNEHFSHFGCRNSKYITSEMLLPWQTGHTSGRYRFKPVSTQEEFHAALLNFGVSKVSTQTAEAMLQHPCPPPLHKLHCYPFHCTLLIHLEINQRQDTRSHFLACVCGV